MIFRSYGMYGQKTNAYGILIGKLKGKKQL